MASALRSILLNPLYITSSCSLIRHLPLLPFVSEATATEIGWVSRMSAASIV
jgi:hypothetical protein